MNVTVRDIDMHFPSMVWFMVKAAVAAVPALVILAVLGGILAAALGGLFMARH